MRIISKKTKGISIATSLTIILWLYFAWHSSSLSDVIPLLASIGGVVVFIGLVIEKEAEDAKESPNHADLNADEKHFIHRKAEIGWMVLMIGIGMEIVLGGAIAAHDVWESNETAKQLAKNDPWKKPIASASAKVRIIFKWDKPPQYADPSLIFERGERTDSWITWMRFGMGSNSILQLSSPPGGVGIWNMGSDVKRSCEIQFGADPMGFLSPDPKRENIPVENFNKVDSFIIQIRPLATNISVESGQVELTVNDLKWTFEIPPQRPKWGLITMQKATTKAGKHEIKVFPVPIIDIHGSNIGVFDGK